MLLFQNPPLLTDFVFLFNSTDFSNRVTQIFFKIIESIPLFYQKKKKTGHKISNYFCTFLFSILKTQCSPKMNRLQNMSYIFWHLLLSISMIQLLNPVHSAPFPKKSTWKHFSDKNQKSSNVCGYFRWNHCLIKAIYTVHMTKLSSCTVRFNICKGMGHFIMFINNHPIGQESNHSSGLFL